MKTASWSHARSTTAVFAAALLLNLTTRSLFYNFDGVACAIAVELSDFKHLVHGNHLAYGVVGWSFDRLWRIFGYQGQSLLTLQALDSVLGAAGAAVFCSLLRRAGRGERESLLGAAALAVSHAWWFWSLEAQVYMLGALFAALTAREALSQKPRAVLIGLWHAGAVLGHVGHLMVLPAIIYAFNRKTRREDAVRYLLSLAAVVALAYALAGCLAVRPSSWAELKLWLLGSAALGNDRAFSWHSAPLPHALVSWSKMTMRIFADFVDRPFLPRLAGIALAAVPLSFAVRGIKEKSREVFFWLLWLAGYALLFISWEPYTIVYRVTDLLPLWALATLGLKTMSARLRAVLLAVWTIAAFAFNFTQTIRPASLVENNPDLVEALWTKESSPENAWILANGRGAVYIPYFTSRRPVNLRYYGDEALLRARLDVLTRAGESVFVSGRTLEEAGLRDKLERYGLKPAAAARNLTMYRVEAISYNNRDLRTKGDSSQHDHEH